MFSKKMIFQTYFRIKIWFNNKLINKILLVNKKMKMLKVKLFLINLIL